MKNNKIQIYFTVNSFLKDLHIKLLRKTRRTVHESAWETALSKFCHTYNSQDAWEIERFGYKNSNLKVKLRILKELLESQFEKNGKFRAEMLNLKAESLRSNPIGYDHLGYSYWFTQDNDCNFRVYQENLDEESWKIVASNREEFIILIDRLKANETITPIDIGTIDDESSTSSDVDLNLGEQTIDCENNAKLNETSSQPDEENEKVAPLKINIENMNIEVDNNIRKPNIKLKFSHQNGVDFVENISENTSSEMVSCNLFNIKYYFRNFCFLKFRNQL